VTAPLRRILVATDFSPCSAPAFERALELAARYGARLLVAHAYQDHHLPQAGFASAERWDEWDRGFREDARKRLAPLVRRAWEAGLEAEALLLTGFPDEALVEAARAHAADLVVVGTHGRRGPARLLLGSVAARVVATAPCPVLVARPPGPAALDRAGGRPPAAEEAGDEQDDRRHQGDVDHAGGDLERQPDDPDGQRQGRE
jgi:nucleotide-binding universal stress UspA family protein